MTYGEVTAMAAFTMRLTAPAVQLAELSNQIQQAKVSLDRIFELMNAEPDAAAGVGRVLPALAGGVSFRDVQFAYERSEEHTSELQSLMRISYAVFCLKK